MKILNGELFRTSRTVLSAIGRSGLVGCIYVVGAVAALYFNSFVLVVQSFLKIPVLHMLAPNGSEPAFTLTQGIVLVFYLVTSFLAVKRFHPERNPTGLP